MNKCITLRPQRPHRPPSQQPGGPAAPARGGGLWCSRPATPCSPSASAAPEDPPVRAAACSPAGSHPAPARPRRSVPEPQHHPVHAQCTVHGAGPWSLARGAWHPAPVHGTQCPLHGTQCRCVVPGAQGTSPFLSSWLRQTFPSPWRWCAGMADGLACQCRPHRPGGSLVQMNIDGLEAAGRCALHPGHVCNKAGPPGRPKLMKIVLERRQ